MMEMNIMNICHINATQLNKAFIILFIKGVFDLDLVEHIDLFTSNTISHPICHRKNARHLVPSPLGPRHLVPHSITAN